MNKLVLIFSWLLLIMLTPACNKDKNKFGDCWVKPNRTQLKLTVLEGPDVTLPSKISIFFKVQDANNNPVGYLKQENFVIYEKGLNDDCYRLISTFEANRRISGRAQIFNHTTLLVLDLSGSVLQQSLVKLQEAATTFIDEIMPDTIDPSVAMGIWYFDGEDKLHPLVPVTSSIFTLKLGISSINKNISVDSSTDLFGAVIKSAEKAQEILQGYQNQQINAATSVVIFTDGRDRANRYTRQAAYNAVAGAAKDISFFTLGVGNEINRSDLQTIGKNGFAETSSISQLTSVFKQIAGLVSNQSNSFYLFEYCSPIRNGNKNGLIIEAFANKEVGFIEAVFDATGFTGGCKL
jgi:uncharacterized protein YegL